jgi:hypothetical protein
MQVETHKMHPEKEGIKIYASGIMNGRYKYQPPIPECLATMQPPAPGAHAFIP